MLDRKFIVENVDAVKQNCTNRGVEADVDELVAREQQRRELNQKVQDLNAQANEVAKKIKGASNEERPALIEEGRRLRAAKDEAQTDHDALDAQILELQIMVPNMAHPEAPIGVDDKSNLEIRRGQHEPRTFDFEVKDHLELSDRIDLFDFPAGATTTGNGFYFLKNEAVLLELALQRYVLGLMLEEGFTPTVTPDLARDDIISGIGFIPRGPETQIYSIENSSLSLVATAEITLGGMYSGHTFQAEELPKKFCGISHCFRTEAGAAGRATRGLYRVHQFTKVEMFAFTLPEQSDATLEQFRDMECKIFDTLEIPYRIVDTATGDLGGPAYRKYDLEAWMPGRGEAGEWGEVTSTSNCTDYQARRLNVRYKEKGKKGTKFVHTLNGTAVAISRALIALVENHQQADGSISVPEVLRAWVGKDVIEPRN